MKSNVLNLRKQPPMFNDREHSTINWVGGFSLEKLVFNHEEKNNVLCVWVILHGMDLMTNVMTLYMHLVLHSSLLVYSHLIN